MDSSPSSSLSATEATQVLKDILNVGKALDLSSDSSLSKTGSVDISQGTVGEMSGSSNSASVNGTSSSQQLHLSGGGDSGFSLMGSGIRSAGEIVSRQQILLEGDDATGSIPIYAREVNIAASQASSVTNTTAGSNKVKISPVTNYDWEQKYYTGNLVAVNHTYIAYALKGRTGYVVRVINSQTSERVLLKGFVGIVVDLSFAHITSNTLACIDEQGNLFVWDLYETDGKILYQARLLVMRPTDTAPSKHHRLIWCPYMPEDISESGSTAASNIDEGGKMLAITHDEKAEVWDLDIVVENHGNGATVQVGDVKDGVSRVNGHSQPITQAALSPDAAVLATASFDGMVKFWQIYQENSDPPRRLHQWTPHEGRPVSCLLFCDNHKHQDPNLPFWRFLLTGADFNREIKVWCTVSWTCLQTIRNLTPSSDEPEPCLRAALDLSASYLIMSDINRKVLYVFEVYQDIEKGHAHISSVCEFLLTQPMLSFAILDANRKKFKHITTADGDVEDESGDIDRSIEKDGCHSNIAVLIKMYCVHTKSLQQLHIRFQPQSSILSPHDQVAGSVSTVSQDEIGVRDQLSDLSMTDIEGSMSDNQGAADNDDELEGDQAPTPTPGSSFTASFTSADSLRSPHQQPVLLPPGAFTSTTPKQSPSQSLRDSHSTTSSLTAVSGINNSADLLSPCDSQALSDSTITLTPTTHRFTPESNRVLTPTQMPLPPITPGEQEIDLAELEKSALEIELGEPPLATSETVKPQTLQKVDSSSSIEIVSNGAELEDASPDIEIVPEPGQDDPSVEPLLDISSGSSQNVLPIEESLKVGEEEEGMPENKMRHSEEEAPDKVPPSSANAAAVAETYRTDEMNATSTEGSIKDNDREVIPQRLDVTVQDIKGDTSDHESLEAASLSSSSSTPGKDKAFKKDFRKERKARSSPRPKKSIPVLSEETSSELSSGIQQLLAMLKTQEQEIKQLRQEVQKHQLNNTVVQSLKSKMDKIEKHIGNKIDTVMAHQSQEEKQRLDAALHERQSMDKQKQEKLLETVSQTLSTTITQKLEKTVRAEMKNCVLPAVNRVVDPLKDQLHQTVAQKLTATDALMKENIGKLVRARSTTEAIGQAAANTVQNAMHSTYRETFQSHIVPAFEKSCQNIFHQINDTFQTGTQEYIKQLERHLQNKSQQTQAENEATLAKMQTMFDAFQASSAEIKKNVVSGVQEELDKQLKKSMTSLQGMLVNKVREVVKQEVSHAMKEQQAVVETSIVNAVRSQAATPVSSQANIQQLQIQIVQLLHQGQLNSAFQLALSASDLHLVVYICQSVSAVQVFQESPCPLEQPVILSLIQQLSAELESDTELKQKYLQEAVMNLDSTHPIAREHMPAVLMSLVQKIDLFVQNNTQNEMARPLRMVSMAARSLLK
ncbi:enhancer of mRNA-decapping protein 4-like [Saccoglossus kowalevskii]